MPGLAGKAVTTRTLLFFWVSKIDGDVYLVVMHREELDRAKDSCVLLLGDSGRQGTFCVVVGFVGRERGTLFASNFFVGVNVLDDRCYFGVHCSPLRLQPLHRIIWWGMGRLPPSC